MDKKKQPTSKLTIFCTFIEIKQNKYYKLNNNLQYISNNKINNKTKQDICLQIIENE